jgi:hypothetical protein
LKKPKNSDVIIDQRIDTMLVLQPDLGEPLTTFISEVYRPYCKAIKRYTKRRDCNIEEALGAVVSLCTNIIREAAYAAAATYNTPEDHPRISMQMTQGVAELLVDGFRNQHVKETMQ